MEFRGDAVMGSHVIMVPLSLAVTQSPSCEVHHFTYKRIIKTKKDKISIVIR
jgi:hypothetical protein